VGRNEVHVAARGDVPRDVAARIGRAIEADTRFDEKEVPAGADRRFDVAGRTIVLASLAGSASEGGEALQ
jgi:hypothetical protein